MILMSTDNLFSPISEVTYAAEKRMALEALRSEFSSNQKSAVDRVAALEDEVCT